MNHFTNSVPLVRNISPIMIPDFTYISCTSVFWASLAYSAASSQMSVARYLRNAHVKHIHQPRHKASSSTSSHTAPAACAICYISFMIASRMKNGALHPAYVIPTTFRPTSHRSLLSRVISFSRSFSQTYLQFLTFVFLSLQNFPNILLYFHSRMLWIATVYKNKVPNICKPATVLSDNCYSTVTRLESKLLSNINTNIDLNCFDFPSGLSSYSFLHAGCSILAAPCISSQRQISYHRSHTPSSKAQFSWVLYFDR